MIVNARTLAIFSLCLLGAVLVVDALMAQKQCLRGAVEQLDGIRMELAELARPSRGAAS